MNFKLSSSKALRILMCVVFLFTSVFSTGIVSATAGPELTSATYNVGTGALVLTGTGFTQINGLKNDIIASKIIFTDGNLNVTPLTGATRNVDRTSDTTASLTVGAADAGTLAKWMVDSSTAAGYKIEVMAGWNGITSLANFTGVPVTISGMPKITAATYDYTAGKLTLTGTDLVSISGARNDILPKYIMMSDDISNLNALTASPSVDIAANKTTAVITLAAKDKQALETFINSNGTLALNGVDTYKLFLTAGWNGPSSMGNMQGVTVTVTNWASPVATALTTATNLLSYYASRGVIGRSNKMGTLYLVDSASVTNDVSTQADLEALVTAKTAVKTPVTAGLVGRNITIKPRGLVMTSSTGAYCFVAVDEAGAVSLKSAPFEMDNGVAPLISPASVSAGTDDNTVVINATPGVGDTLMYRIITSSAPAFVDPHILLSQARNGLTTYTPGTGILGVSKLNFVELFEVNANNQIVKYKLITGTTAKLDQTPPSISSTDINAAKDVITITMSEPIVSSGGAAKVWPEIQYSLDDGANYTTASLLGLNGGPLGDCTSQVATTISSTAVVLAFQFSAPATSSRVLVKIGAGTINDLSGNSADILTATAYDHSSFNIGVPTAAGTLSNGDALYNVKITSAQDMDGNSLNKSEVFTTVTSKDGAAVSTTSGAVNFVYGEATIPVLVSTTGAQNVLINIADVSSTLSSANINVTDNSDSTVGTITTSAAAAEGQVYYTIPITGAKDAYGIPLNGTIGYSITSTCQGSSVSAGSGNAVFNAGATTLYALITRQGTQTLTIHINGVSVDQTASLTFTDASTFTVGTPTSNQQINNMGHLQSGSILYNIPITGAVDAFGTLLDNVSKTFTVVTSSAGVNAAPASGSAAFTAGAASIPVTISGTGDQTVSIHIDGISSTNSSTVVSIAAENALITSSLPAGKIIAAATGPAFTYNLTVNARDFAGIGFTGAKSLFVNDSGAGDINPTHTASFNNGTAIIPVSFSTPGAHVVTISSNDCTATTTQAVTVSTDASTAAVVANGGSAAAIVANTPFSIQLSNVYEADGTQVVSTVLNVVVTSTAAGNTVALAQSYAANFDSNGVATITGFTANTTGAYAVTIPGLTGTWYSNNVNIAAYTTGFIVSSTTSSIEVVVDISAAKGSDGVLLEGTHAVTVTSSANATDGFTGNVLFHDGVPVNPVIAKLTQAGTLTVTIAGVAGGNQTVVPTTTGVSLP